MVVPINVIVSYEAENVTNVTQFVCRKNQEVNAEKTKTFHNSNLVDELSQGSAAVILTPGLLGVLTNMYIMLLIVSSYKLRRFV